VDYINNMQILLIASKFVFIHFSLDLNVSNQFLFHLVHSTLVDRLGDQKDQVRDASITLLTNIMDVAASPQVG